MKNGALAYLFLDEGPSDTGWNNHEYNNQLGLTKKAMRRVHGLHFKATSCKKCRRLFKSQHRREIKIEFFCIRCRKDLTNIYDPTVILDL